MTNTINGTPTDMDLEDLIAKVSASMDSIGIVEISPTRHMVILPQQKGACFADDFSSTQVYSPQEAIRGISGCAARCLIYTKLPGPGGGAPGFPQYSFYFEPNNEDSLAKAEKFQRDFVCLMADTLIKEIKAKIPER